MSNVETARLACSFFLARLRGEASRLLQITFPGHDPGPRKWIRFISGLIDTAEGYLEEAALASTDPNDASRLINDAENLSDSSYKLLMHVAGADAGQIPHQIVAPFQRWVKDLGITNTIFFRAEHLPNYELATFDYGKEVARINKPSTSLIESTSKIDWPVLRVTVPGQAMGMLPHFAVVGHELGHAIQDRIIIDMAKHALADAACIKAIDARLRANSSFFGTDERVRASGILLNWINEIKADAVGHYLSGPAFFFAICGLLELSGRGYGLGATHPPSTLRRRLLLTYLSKGSPSFVDIMQADAKFTLDEQSNSPHLNKCPAGDTLFNELLPALGLIDAAICTELIPFLEIIAPDIYDESMKVVSGISPQLIYNAENLRQDISIHLEPLLNLIPPIEYSLEDRTYSSSLATILNIGWVALLTGVHSIPVASNDLVGIDALRMERLHDLLLKAVELAEARTLWDEQV